MNWKTFFKTLAHAAVSASLVAATSVVQSGAAITSGNVLIPSLVAGALAAVHALMPSTTAPTTTPQS